MEKIRKELSRRNLLRYLGNSMVMLPLMRTLMETQAFGETQTKRAVFYYYPNGIIRDRFHPKVGPLSKVDGLISSPLLQDGLRNDVNLISGMNWDMTNSHEGGTHHALTGLDWRSQGISLDTYLGQRLKARIPVVRLGAAKQFWGSHIHFSISFNADGTPTDVEDNPSQSFVDIFGKAAEPTPTKGLSKALRSSLLDDCLDDVKSLQSRIGSIEKTKLDTHLESLRELERRLQAGPPDQASGPVCSKDSIKQTKKFPLGGPEPHEYWTPENFDYVAEMNNQIAIQALACGVTNVATLMLSHMVSNIPFRNGRPNSSGQVHHEYSHTGPEDHVKNQVYMMTKIANFIKGMQEVKEGDKSLLHNSVVMAFSELGWSQAHDFNNMGIVMAGQAGGFFKTGSCIDVSGSCNNHMLTTIAQSMGINEKAFNTKETRKAGPIAKLIAS